MPVIKELKTMEELKLVQDMEKRVWEMSPIPIHQTFTAVKNGGLMLAAFVDDEIVGFSYGFPGFKNGKSYLCSHMLAIDPGYRSRKIGEKLKWRQREVAMDKGYDMIQWTFDPLETRNGYLNLSKLNGVCNTYIENCYGEMSDGMNKGLPSDRFEVHWYLNSSHVTQRTQIDMDHSVPLNAIRKNEDGLPVFFGEQTCELDDDAYSLAVPKDFQELKLESADLALDWRLKTREKFEQLFDAGYSAVHLKVHDDHAEYIFVKTEDLKIAAMKEG